MDCLHRYSGSSGLYEVRIHRRLSVSDYYPLKSLPSQPSNSTLPSLLSLPPSLSLSLSYLHLTALVLTSIHPRKPPRILAKHHPTALQSSIFNLPSTSSEVHIVLLLESLVAYLANKELRSTSLNQSIQYLTSISLPYAFPTRSRL